MLAVLCVQWPVGKCCAWWVDFVDGEAIGWRSRVVAGPLRLVKCDFCQLGEAPSQPTK